ncbi:MAG: ATP-binding protein [Desulfuromonadaceae bacterium]|nr:ATP-binding protein [Desulfuromonadaceae bacterium]
MQTPLDFIIGSEKRLAEIISRAEMEPLLRSLVTAGPLKASVLDENELPLCRQGEEAALRPVHEIRHALLVEGEPKGTLVVLFTDEANGALDALALLARDALQLIVNNNLKRMLTTELHTSVVQESYDQLVETNRQLSASEKRYRELAASLERKVEERTAELQKAYTRMLQQEKLAAVGGLAAGMAHEINNPNGFIRSNLMTFSRYIQKIREMLTFYQLRIAGNTPLMQLQQETDTKRRELKIDFILSDATELLAQSVDGSDQIARIVGDLKSFSHVDETGEADADLNEELRRTLTVLSSHKAEDTEIELNLQPLPLFGCNPGLISQAFFNLLLNALQSRKRGLKLVLSSHCFDNMIQIRISDNGYGIAAKNLPRVFEPFFTTKEVGSGTGMGLTVAREIICAAGGSIDISSTEHAGTTATIQLPLEAGNR